MIKRQNYKKINIFDINGRFLCSANSLKEANKITNVDYRNISAICNKKRKSGNNFIFRYDGDNDFSGYKNYKPIKKNKKKIAIYENNIFLCNAESISSATKLLNASSGSISRAINKNIKYKNYTFKLLK